MSMTQFRTGYMDDALFDLAKVIEEARGNLRGVDFDTLVGTGFSGVVVVPALALAMDKSFVLIRKESDDSHHGGGRLVGELGGRWIFVDDFVASGKTRARVVEKVDEAVASRGLTGVTMVGQYIYASHAPTGFKSFDMSRGAS